MMEAGSTFVGYTRVSTEEQAAGLGLGLKGQRAAIEAYADAHDWHLLDIYVEEATTRKARPILEEAMVAAKACDGLIVAKLDRLTRSLLEFLVFVKQAQKEDWALVILDHQFDMTTPYGKAMASMMATFGELERDLISERTKAALAVRKSLGLPVGRPVEIPDQVVDRMVELFNGGLSYSAIARKLDEEGVKPPHAKRWHHSSVQRCLRRRLQEGS